MIDIYAELCVKHADGHDIEQLAVKISELCESLALEHDVIRCKYWNYVAERFRLRFERSKTSNEQCHLLGGAGGSGNVAATNDVPM